MNTRMAFGILLAIVLIVGAVGLGVYGYNLGLAQGLAQSDKLPVPPTGAAPYPYFGYPYFFRPFGFGFGFLGCLIPLLFLFVLFGVMRMVFWRASWGGMHHRHGAGGVPPMFEEWHKKAHEAK
ncbi:MAG: hypothetical protein HY782_27025 [Chloroflexi bacterium]|nr:hypothetical protein [Chloroflexota bacterium]